MQVSSSLEPATGSRLLIAVASAALVAATDSEADVHANLQAAADLAAVLSVVRGIDDPLAPASAEQEPAWKRIAMQAAAAAVTALWHWQTAGRRLVMIASRRTAAD